MRNPICDVCGKVGEGSTIDAINISLQFGYSEVYNITRDMCKECQAATRANFITTIEMSFPEFIKYIPKAEKPCV